MAEVAAAAPESREIRVFLSSTFRDFNEERKLLATRVFPRLNREARKRGVELVEVDLRWGVTQQQAEDGHALEICLQEIERCKPYFIGMLGDSYGSLTPSQRQLLQAAPSLLEERQWLDGRIGEASYTELEIEHSLQLLRDPAIAGKAFYFRDPGYSTPKADAGEAGWRSDTPEDRQKLELLRQRIRDSGFPRTEGLKDPQAVVDQIEKDLWALIDQQFPEGEQPDALEKEARKHADYRRSRTEAGQYIGGADYIQQLEQWIGAGEQQILITGESGAGKSALIANWIEAHQQSRPDDVIYAHHLGCTNDANALRPLLARLIDTASLQLLGADVITEPLAVPEDWWELVARVTEALQNLGRWCQQQGKRWIWVLDGLDRLVADDQNALPWLPQTLPNGVQVVASALACPVREILKERGYTTLTIQPLEEKEQQQLIQRYLHRYTKELDGGLRQQILSHNLAGSPLFLKVLLEELRQCGRHDTLKKQLEFYLSSQTVDDLYERVLERLETDGSGEAVKKVMTALWTSRAGLTEPELLEITDLKQLQWAPIDLALEKAFGRNGNRLVFDHDYLRQAVEDRYLPIEEARRQAHTELSNWFLHLTQVNSRKYEELPWQYMRAGKYSDLRAWLLDPWNLANLGSIQGSREVLGFWQKIRNPEDARLDKMISKRVGKEIQNCYNNKGDLEHLARSIADILEEAGMHGPLLLQLDRFLVELSRFEGEGLYLTRLARLAREQNRQGFYAEASKLARECLMIGASKLEGRSLADLLYELAGLQEEAGEIEEALFLYQQCLDIEKRIAKTLRPDVLMTMEHIAALKLQMGHLNEGESAYQACIEGYHTLLGKGHSLSVSAVTNFVNLQLKYGAPSHALPIIRQHAGWCLEERGKQSAEYLKAARLFAVALRETGRLKEAETKFKEVISSLNDVSNARSHKKIKKDAIGGLSLGGLAQTLELAGKLEQALEFRQQALDHRLAHEGPDAWWTNHERLGLARVLHALGRSKEAALLLDQLNNSMACLADPDNDDRQLIADAAALRRALEAGESQ